MIVDRSLDRFTLSSRDFEPAYVALQRCGELGRRAKQALVGLSRCTYCPRRCGASRLAGEMEVCRAERLARTRQGGVHPYRLLQTARLRGLGAQRRLDALSASRATA